MSIQLSWFLLVLAGLFEVVWVTFLKESNGLSKLVPTMIFIFSLALSMALLGVSMRIIPMSLSYPIWTGIGAIGSVLVGYLFYSEPLGLLKLVFLTLILIGIVGLKYSSQ